MTSSTMGATRPSASSGTTSRTKPAVASAFSAALRARSTVPMIVSRLAMMMWIGSVARGPADRADQHDATQQRRRGHVGLDVAPAREVDRHVRAAFGQLDDRPRERVGVELAVFLRRNDCVRETERSATFEFRLRARGADDPRAERGRELQRGGTDSRPDRVHEHPLAGLERSPW